MGYVQAAQLAAIVRRHREAAIAGGLPARVAFVLPPGGAAGAYQAGAVEALAEHGVHPDLVVGASAGALNGLGLVLDALAPPLPGTWPHTRLGRLWRRLSGPAGGAGLLVDKPALLGALAGKPGAGTGVLREAIGGALAGLPHAREAWAGLQAGLFDPGPLRALLAATIGEALGEADAAPERAGHLLADAWAAGRLVGRAGGPAGGPPAGPPALVALATDLDSQEAVAFVLGDADLTERLFRRRHPVRALGRGALAGTAVVDALLASAAIPGAFPAVSLPADRPGDRPGEAPRRYVDGAIAASEPFHLAIDAGATLVVSLEVIPYARPPRPDAPPPRHPLATAADALLAIQGRYLRADARGVAIWNRRLALGPVEGRRHVPLYRLAPAHAELGLLDFEGRWAGGERTISLYDWYMEGYGDAGGDARAAWAAYVRWRDRRGDAGVALAHAHEPGFWEATEQPAPRGAGYGAGHGAGPVADPAAGAPC